MSYKIFYFVLRDLSKPIAVQHESKKEKYMQTYGVGSFELSTFISFVHHYYPKPSLPLRALSSFVKTSKIFHIGICQASLIYSYEKYIPYWNILKRLAFPARLMSELKAVNCHEQKIAS